MIKKLLFILLLCPVAVSAQIVTIPDAGFSAALVAAYWQNSAGTTFPVDANGDGLIQTTEAAAVLELNIEAAGSFASMQGISQFTNLTKLWCGNNGVQSLPLSGLSGLTELYCSNNMLTSLDISALPALQKIQCFNNQLTTLTVGTLPNLVYVDCGINSLTSLDFSNAPLLNNISFDYNPDLTYVNLKNGSSLPALSAVYGSNTPQLHYVCADEEEISLLTTYFASVSEPVNVNSYCSFVPGGNYNTITGTVKFDVNNGGCDAAEYTQMFIKVTITDGTNIGSAFTNAAGQYTFYTGTGTFTVAPEFEIASYYNAVTAGTTVFPLLDGSLDTHNFCVTANGTHQDLEAVMEPVTNAVPGFDATYKIVYKNKGNTVINNGTASCTWNPAILDPVGFSQMPNYSGSNYYSWNYSNLQPFESREIIMVLNINGPTEAPPVNAGDVIPFTATANGNWIDDTMADNTFRLNQVVVSSLDPNDIVCIQGDNAPVTQIGDYLHYVVHFENTGTAPANFVVVTEELNPAMFDISSLQILNSSHPVQARVNDNTNTVEFVFANAALGVADHGNILFKVKTKHNLVSGDAVSNQANIYFDYNQPLLTNQATTLFGIMGTNNPVLDASVAIYPNPASTQVKIQASGSIKTISLYDVQGRLLQTGIYNDVSEATLDIASRSAGIYFIKVTTATGSGVQKLVKQ